MKIKSLFFLAVFLVLIVTGSVVMAQNHSDWTGFSFEAVRYDDKDRIVCYELKKDYTVNLADYFLDPDKLPDAVEGDADYYRGWATVLPPVDWDFIRIEQGGILTIKKGYRWDGASYLCKTYEPDNPFFCVDEYFNFRASLVHDALYDLMRMEYLAPDTNHWPEVSDDCLDTHIIMETGDHNRKLADLILYMIGMEDGQEKGNWDDPLGSHTAESDYFWMRTWGACATHEDARLEPWKYHVSDLTAWPSDGQVDLHFQPADLSLASPTPFGELPKLVNVLRRSDSTSPWITLFPPIMIDLDTILNYQSSDVFFTDDTVENDVVYHYKVDSGFTDPDDTSNEEYVSPVDGPGKALILDGIDDYIAANTVANDVYFNYLFPFNAQLTLEAWVYPDPQTGKSAILAFNTISGGNENILMYDGDSQTFCYYDPTTSYVHSAESSAYDRWHHVAVTIEFMTAQGILYVNGEQQATFATHILPSVNASFSIGQEWDNAISSNHFKGMIDEARVWKTIRSEAQINSNMCSPMRGDESDLVALWHFDDDNDLVFPPNVTEPLFTRKTFDGSGHANDGVLYGYGDNVIVKDTAFVPSTGMLPTADAGPDQSVDEGQVVNFDGTGSWTLCGTITDYEWDFGDSSPVRDGPLVDHTYADDGNYTVTLTAGSDTGSEGTDTLAVEVVNVAPDVDAGEDQTIQAGETVNFTGAFTDPGTDDTHTILWDFGDDNTAENTLTPSHTYDSGGSYLVTLTVTDDDGGIGTDTLAVSVCDYIPDIKANGQDGPVTVVPGTSVTLTVSMDAGICQSAPADWWLVAVTPMGLYSYVHPAGWRQGLNVAAQMPLMDLSTLPVFTAPISLPGTYRVYFAADDNADSVPDGTWQDTVQIIVQP